MTPGLSKDIRCHKQHVYLHQEVYIIIICYCHLQYHFSRNRVLSFFHSFLYRFRVIVYDKILAFVVVDLEGERERLTGNEFDLILFEDI